MVAMVPQAHRDRVGKLVGDIYAAGLDMKDVYKTLEIPSSTWNSALKASNNISEAKVEQVLHDAEIYVSGILRELRNEG